jgi:uncharacterized protein (DUF2141 family)
MSMITPFVFCTKFRRAKTFAAGVAGLIVMLAAVGNFDLSSRAQAMPICESSGIPIWVTIEKVRSSNGTIKVELYRGEAQKNQKKRKKVARTRVKARQGETKLCLNAPTVGDYAISLYHDENDNKKFDRNFIGIPREGFGFSNNPPIGLGVPPQKEMRFKVESMATRVRILVVYL